MILKGLSFPGCRSPPQDPVVLGLQDLFLFFPPQTVTYLPEAEAVAFTWKFMRARLCHTPWWKGDEPVSGQMPLPPYSGHLRSFW